RKRAGIEVKRKPVSFIFAGPTGVGKTELVKALAECVFGSEEALIRVDMSEYMEKHSVSKLIGSPPGYVGYDEAGQLTERVRRNPYSVILLDEIEKAHEDVFNIFLQVLDDGRITDSQGRVINFENTIIVMTTNAGSQLSAGNMGFESESGESRYEKVLSQMFRPEFINRIDEIVEFAYLEKDELLQIVSLMLSDLVKGLAEKGITADITDAAKALVVEKGYKRKFGARPMRRIIMKHIEDEIAKLIISGALADANKITVDAVDDEFVLKYE
ncbi:MAG: ATP-dependent Clp protease ATP-binding subunit, partial [Clostridia bacterium]|nr:ATP-dependent Clp protease ATP-binding subunit [Clostridia bacterium]